MSNHSWSNCLHLKSNKNACFEKHCVFQIFHYFTETLPPKTPVCETIEHWLRISTCAFKSVPTMKIILKEKRVAFFFFLIHFVVVMLFGDAEILSAIHYFFIWLLVCHLSFKLISLKVHY